MGNVFCEIKKLFIEAKPEKRSTKCYYKYSDSQDNHISYFRNKTSEYPRESIENT